MVMSFMTQRPSTRTPEMFIAALMSAQQEDL
jgi:hypothetical protein